MQIVTAAQPHSTAFEGHLHLRYIWTIALVAAMGGLLFGYDWVVIGGAKPFFMRFSFNSLPQLRWDGPIAAR